MTSPKTKTPQYLGGLAQITLGPSPGVVSHYNVQPVIDIYGAVQERDLGAVSSDIDRNLSETRKDLPRGSYVAVRGQVHTMTSAYSQLYFGLAGAVVLVYLVIVVTAQSWLDPFIIITALPGALAGNHLDAVHDRDDTVGPGIDGRGHVHGHSNGQQRAIGELRP